MIATGGDTLTVSAHFLDLHGGLVRVDETTNDVEAEFWPLCARLVRSVSM
jgi:hypothetical protein